ncbi:MAG TPA: hypothetical protein VMP08_05540 [Anaerolineae bacterium]|nr:hypothetical protein [Anaerolineae bacterium]
MAEHIALPLKRFLIVEECPPEWRGFDLYLFRDDEVVFYVGQSHLAYDRVWQHIADGYKARSVVGRFVLCNWPSSMRFTIELWSSQADRFAVVDHDLNAAERLLIEQVAPCFNDTYNLRPTPLPDRYAPPNGLIRCSRSPNKLIHEAARAVQADERRVWLTK